MFQFNVVSYHLIDVFISTVTAFHNQINTYQVKPPWIMNKNILPQ